ncbi:MAG TPA: amidohydrolase family protein [Terracidiphilus sp.]|jgi:imidazolonepropionase-like amidohydrolase
MNSLFGFRRFRPVLAWSSVTLLSTLCLPLFAQVPADQLAKPPAGAQEFTVLSTSGTNGKSYNWTAEDGSLMSRSSVVLRGMKWDVDQRVRFGADHMPASIEVRGMTPNGDAAETFDVTGQRAKWQTQVDKGEAAYGVPAFYVAVGGTFSDPSFTEALLRSPDKSLALLPGGRATAERLTELTVGEGARQKKIVAWAVSGLGPSPSPVWTTEDGKFFGAAGGLSVLPAGYESALKAMIKTQDEALSARSPILAKRLAKIPAGPVVFTHVRAFVDGERFVDDQTVVVEHGLIASVGPSVSASLPGGAQVIDGAGKTLVPGLWDSHMHVGDDFAGPFLLSLGITSARDPGNDNELTVARAGRRARGDLLMPHVYPSSLIDGKGPNSAQLGTVVTSVDEAVAAVRKAKADGFTGIKFYGSYNPAWVAPAAAEAHKLGLHVHGHVPAGMRPSEAIAAGYDEITHIYFVSMEAMPKDVVDTSNGINRFNGTGRYARDLDLNAAPIKPLLETMAAKHIYADPTLVVVESLFVPENGDLSPAYAPYVGTLPPASERGFRTGGFIVPSDLTRADFRKSYDKLQDLVGLMHKDGIPIVAGTDGSGMELVRELELYIAAGFTPEEALEAATIVPARLVHADKTTGSIAVGKVADLVLVEGDPSRRIGDLRNTRVVMMDGKLMDADELRSASGFSGRPKTAE